MRSLFSRFSGSLRGPCSNSRCVCDSWGINRRWDCAAARGLWQRHQSGTYLYTAIFAAALTVDAREKSRRTQQWDDALAHVNDEAKLLQAAAEEKEKRLRRHPKFAGVKFQEPIEEDAWTAMDVAAHIDDDQAPILRFVPIIPVTVTQDAIRLHALDDSGTRPRRSHAMPLPPTIAEQYGVKQRDPNEMGLPPQSMWAGKKRREVADSATGTLKKFKLLELCTTSLICSILDVARTAIDAQTPFSEGSTPKATNIWVEQDPFGRSQLKHYLRTTISSVDRSSDKWSGYDRASFDDFLPVYPNSSRGEMRKQRLRLHNRLQHAFTTFENESSTTEKSAPESPAFARLCLRVCKALHRSDAAPSTTTFNILCTGFLGSTAIPEMVKNQLVVDLDYFQSNAHIRPNELTCAAMLNAYRERKDWKAFARYVARMRGQEGGLMLARPDITITSGSQGRLVPWVKPSGKYVVVQAVTPHPMMFVEMIKGAVDFAGIESALTMLEDLRPEGWQSDWQCLETLLLACVKRKDWSNGQLVWKEIQTLGRELKNIPTQMYSAFLALCHMCRQKIEFQVIFRQAQGDADMDSILAQIRGILHFVKHGHVNVKVAMKTAPTVAAASQDCTVTATTTDLAVHQTTSAHAGLRAPAEATTIPEKATTYADSPKKSAIRTKQTSHADMSERLNRLITKDAAPQITEEERQKFSAKILERSRWFEHDGSEMVLRDGWRPILSPYIEVSED